MTKIKNNPLLKGASGMLGNVIVFREHRGQLIMANRPKKGEVPTEQQRLAKIRFMRAVHYGKQQVANPVTKAEYATAIGTRSTSAYAAAVNDYLTVPVIDLVDVSGYHGAVGDIIAIIASDDFKVVSVSVTIAASNGDLIEQGEAQLRDGTPDGWNYVATVAKPVVPGTKVVVLVSDKPGNVTRAEKLL
jgi:hypothetical protein